MGKWWKYVFVAVLALMIGSASVAEATKIKEFVISDADGTQIADVPDGPLLIYGEGDKFPTVEQVEVLGHADPSTIFNGIVVIKDIAPGTCSEDFGLRYVVPAGKTLLVTDSINGLGDWPLLFWTDTRGDVLRVFARETHLQTPLRVGSGEMLCLYLDAPPGSKAEVFLSGRLVDAAPKLTGQIFTLLDRVDVAATATITSDYINLEGFSEFKVYFQRHNEVEKGQVNLKIWESMDGIRDTDSPQQLNLPNSVTDTDRRLVLSDAPYLNVRAEVFNDTEGDTGAGTQNVSVFLYAVR